MTTHTFSATPRALFGKKTKSLRRQGFTPANIYGNKVTPQSIQISTKDFLKLYEQTGETSVINLTLDGESVSRPVLVTNVQFHALDESIVHVDFRQVDLKQAVTADIPVEFVGDAPALKLGGVLVPTLSEIEVEALPNDLPEKITVSLDTLTEIGSTISVGDLKLDAKIKVLSDPLTPVVSIQAQQQEEPEPVATPAAAETAAPAPAPDAAAKSE